MDGEEKKAISIVKGVREGSCTRKDEMKVKMKTNEWNRKRRKEMKG